MSGPRLDAGPAIPAPLPPPLLPHLLPAYASTVATPAWPWGPMGSSRVLPCAQPSRSPCNGPTTMAWGSPWPATPTQLLLSPLPRLLFPLAYCWICGAWAGAVGGGRPRVGVHPGVGCARKDPLSPRPR